MLLLSGVFTLTAAADTDMLSPNGKLTVDARARQLGISYQGRQVLSIDIKGAAKPWSRVRTVKEDYQMLTGKRLHCTNEANEYRSGDILLRIYNDGIAIRNAEMAYHIPEGTKRWMQQWCDSYEGFFPLSTTCRVAPVPSYSGISKSADGWNNRWGYPALLEPVTDVFALITEGNIEKGQSASCLMNDGELFRVVEADHAAGKRSDHTPWRLAIIGTLSEVVESTLVTDVSEACKIKDTSWIQPGTVSWIYWAYNHGSSNYDIIRQYVDMAEVLHLPYVLIDAEWDEMQAKTPAGKEAKSIEDAVAYARQKGVKPLIWYNSSIGWVDGAPGPKFRLNNPKDREREFAWCEKLGVAGVKIDFFSGDNQQNMDYCIDLLESAARHHLLVNFHGATIPRGWQRTYPNLMTTEGVYGAEWYNNVATFTDKAACHNATLPFTRNVIGPMDYTPCTFSNSQHPHITTQAHELALTVLFESGLQHLADRPESYLTQPREVQQFLSQLPTVWDETRLVSGYPGETVVIARRHGTTWYVAGINGTDKKQILYTPLDFIAPAAVPGLPMASPVHVTLYTDGDPWTIQQEVPLLQAISCQPRGGFVLTVRK